MKELRRRAGVRFLSLFLSIMLGIGFLPVASFTHAQDTGTGYNDDGTTAGGFDSPTGPDPISTDGSTDDSSTDSSQDTGSGYNDDGTTAGGFDSPTGPDPVSTGSTDFGADGSESSLDATGSLPGTEPEAGSAAAESKAAAIAAQAEFEDSFWGQVAEFLGFTSSVELDPSTGLYSTTLNYESGPFGLIGTIIGLVTGFIGLGFIGDAIDGLLGLDPIVSIPIMTLYQYPTVLVIYTSGSDIFGSTDATLGESGGGAENAADSSATSGGTPSGNEATSGDGSSVCTSPAILSATQAGATAGKPFTYTIRAEGTAPLTHRVDRPTLPEGLEFSENRITGIVATDATGAGRSTMYAVRIYTDNLCGKAAKVLTLTVYPASQTVQAGSSASSDAGSASEAPALGGGGCPAVYDPVCGIDLKTYSSACVASSQGMTDFMQGTCKPPTVTLSVTPTAVPYNTTATLQWSSTDASACIVGGDWPVTQAQVFRTVRVAPHGSRLTPKILSSKKYQLFCENRDGAKSETATVFLVVEK